MSHVNALDMSPAPHPRFPGAKNAELQDGFPGAGALPSRDNICHFCIQGTRKSSHWLTQAPFLLILQ